MADALALAGQPAANAGTVVPQTLYVNNLNDKIKQDTLKKSLQEVFSAFGKIEGIVAMKSLRRRGQAWISYADPQAAARALSSLQGFPFYNKPMRIAWSRMQSDVITKANGTYIPRPKKESLKKGDVKKQKQKAPVAAPTAAGGAAGVSAMGMAGMPGMGMGMPAQGAPQINIATASVSELGGGGTAPNKTLFVENLPEGATDTMLAMLFRQYPGFVEVRSIPGRNMAFVEYQSEMNSQMAMSGLQKFQITPTNTLAITFSVK